MCQNPFHSRAQNTLPVHTSIGRRPYLFMKIGICFVEGHSLTVKGDSGGLELQTDEHTALKPLENVTCGSDKLGCSDVASTVKDQDLHRVHRVE